MKHLKLLFIFFIFTFILSCGDSTESEQKVSLGSTIYNELNKVEIKLLAAKYNSIQEELNSIILNMSDNDLIAIEKLKTLSEEGAALKMSMKNLSPDNLKNIYNEILRKPIPDEMINKLQKRYSNDAEFKKAYDTFVKAITI